MLKMDSRFGDGVLQGEDDETTLKIIIIAIVRRGENFVSLGEEEFVHRRL